jgi:hypothetical protein
VACVYFFFVVDVLPYVCSAVNYLWNAMWRASISSSLFMCCLRSAVRCSCISSSLFLCVQ